MKFFDKLVGKSQNGNQNVSRRAESNALAVGPAPDLVDGINALAEYYRFLEAQAYDRGLKSVRERRDFREEYLRRIDALLEYADDVVALAQIQYEMDKEASFSANGRLDEHYSLDAEARNLDPRGFDLLSPALPLTYDSLKAAYRTAAKKNHPDVGGNNATMQYINDAYAMFSALVRRSDARSASSEVSWSSPTHAVAEFFADVRFANLGALIDDFNVNEALRAFRALTSQQYVERFDAAQTLARLVDIAAACARSKEAEEVLTVLKSVTDALNARGMNFGPVYESATRAIASPKHRFVFNHMRQADNALRFGIINEKRHEEVAVRIGATEEQLSEEAEAFASFVRGVTFLDLPSDIVPNDVPAPGLIPGPDYYARVETLTEAQRGEYMRAYHGGAANLASKYAAVRIDALMRAPFGGFLGLSDVSAEIRMLGEAPGLKAGVRQLCAPAAMVVEFLMSLPVDERSKRINLLLAADADPRQAAASIILDSSGVRMEAMRPIFPNSQYADFAMGPLDRIERYLRTGSVETPIEHERRMRQQREEYDDIRAFHSSEVYIRAQEARRNEENPVAIAEAFADLCEAMYLRVNGAGDRWLELGYWTNQLTITLVKLKRFTETVTWIERFNTAPEAARSRTSTSIMKSLEKRLERARRAFP